MLPTRVGVNPPQLDGVVTKHRMFPTLVGVIRSPPRDGHRAPHVPHACGGEPFCLVRGEWIICWVALASVSYIGLGPRLIYCGSYCNGEAVCADGTGRDNQV